MSSSASQAYGSQLDELRALLLTPEQEKQLELEQELDALSFRLSNPEQRIKDISEVVPEAIKLRQEKDDSIGEIIKPAVEAAVKNSVKGDPNEMAEALFPIVGPVVRKAIAAALSGKSDEDDFSLEQVFLIHKETGLLLSHELTSEASVQDADMVSGMLTAIQDFVHDAFSANAHDGLDSMRVGNLTVLIEWGPEAVLAVVVKGNPPDWLQEKLLILLEMLHQTYAKQLEAFSGDGSVFSDAALLSQLAPEKPKQRGSKFSLILLIVGLSLLIYGVFWFIDSLRWRSYVASLEAQPGIRLIQESHHISGFSLSGLIDPLAQDPTVLLKRENLNPERVQMNWQSYLSLEPKLVLERANKKLEPPRGVILRIEEGVLIFPQNAPRDWLEIAREKALLLPGIESTEMRERL